MKQNVQDLNKNECIIEIWHDIERLCLMLNIISYSENVYTVGIFEAVGCS